MIELDLQLATEASDLPAEAQLRRWVELALRQRTADSELTIRLVDAEEGQELNAEYRGKDSATNVLSFALNEGEEAVAGLPLMGDIVLAAEVVAREAAEQGKDLHAHYAHLTVHGMLHLQGHDHETDTEAEAMEALETVILARLGYTDPYAVEH